MGYSASAKLVYGVKLSTSDLTVTSRERGCSHPLTNTKFCGQCGRPMYVTSTSQIEVEIDGLELHYSDYESLERVVGIAVGSSTDGIQRVPAFDAESLGQMVHAACQKAGLDLAGKPMGLYQILVHSY